MAHLQHLGNGFLPTHLSSEPLVWAPGEEKEVPDSLKDTYLDMRGPKKEVLFKEVKARRVEPQKENSK